MAKCAWWTDAAGNRLQEPLQEAADQGKCAMRYLYIGLIVVFTALVLLFKFQNLETATVSLFSASITLPVSALVFGVYVLGMLTGGCLYALLKSWVRGARQGT
jgi:putative membrane protein